MSSLILRHDVPPLSTHYSNKSVSCVNRNREWFMSANARFGHLVYCFVFSRIYTDQQTVCKRSTSLARRERRISLLFRSHVASGVATPHIPFLLVIEASPCLDAFSDNA